MNSVEEYYSFLNILSDFFKFKLRKKGEFFKILNCINPEKDRMS